MPKDHGSRKIVHNNRTIIVDLNRIQYAVQTLIESGIVLQVEKTKSGRTDHCNGKNWVTLGTWKAAAYPEYNYAMYISNNEWLFTDSYNATKTFINWVGRDKAREAIREYARNH